MLQQDHLTNKGKRFISSIQRIVTRWKRISTPKETHIQGWGKQTRDKVRWSTVTSRATQKETKEKEGGDVSGVGNAKRTRGRNGNLRGLNNNPDERILKGKTRVRGRIQGDENKPSKERQKRRDRI